MQFRNWFRAGTSRKANAKRKETRYRRLSATQCILEQRRLLAFDIDLVPVGDFLDLGHANGADHIAVSSGGQLEFEVYFSTDTPSDVVGWQLQFDNSSSELAVFNFVQEPRWIALGDVDTQNGSTLAAGANFFGVEFNDTPQLVGSFEMIVPADSGSQHLLTVNGSPGPDRTGISDVAGPLEISDFGDVLLQIGIDPGPPTAIDDQLVVAGSFPVTFDPLLNDVGIDLELIDFGDPQNGTITRLDGSNLSYMADHDFTGMDSFQYAVRNNWGTDTGTVNIVVNSVMPQAIDDTFEVERGRRRNLRVLSNDMDPGGTLRIISVTQGSLGRITLFSGGLSYVSYHAGVDQFSYQVSDDNGETSEATVTVTVVEADGITLDFQPSTDDVQEDAGPNGEDIITVPVGSAFEMVATMRSLVRTYSIVGWQLQFCAIDHELDAHHFMWDDQWIPLGPLAIMDNQTLVSGANFDGVDVGTTPITLGTFTIQSPSVAGDYLLPFSAGSLCQFDTTGVTSLIGNIEIVDYGDIIVRTVADDEHVDGLLRDDFAVVVASQVDTIDVLDNDEFEGSIFAVEGSDNATIAEDGLTLEYTADSNAGTSDSFTYWVRDEFGQIASATVDVLIVDEFPNNRFEARDGDLLFFGSPQRDRIEIRTNSTGAVLIITDTQSFGPLRLPLNGILRVFGQDGNDDIRVAGYLDIAVNLDGGNGNDRLTGGSGLNFLQGGPGNDWLLGGIDGVNHLFAGPGNDRLLGARNDDILFGREGNDYLIGGSGDDYIHGGEGNDSLFGNGGSDILLAGNGDDLALGGSEADFVFGGGDSDRLKGEEDDDLVVGGHGQDLVNGGRGDDVLVGDVSGSLALLNAGALLDEILRQWNLSLLLSERIELLPDFIEEDDADLLLGRNGHDFFFVGHVDNASDVIAGQDQIADLNS